MHIVIYNIILGLLLSFGMIGMEILTVQQFQSELCLIVINGIGGGWCIVLLFKFSVQTK